MDKQGASPEDLSAWKAQQEANRAARVRQLHSPAELWQMEQEALDALSRLRPDWAAKHPTGTTPSDPDNARP
jgi:hypothetical protein